MATLGLLACEKHNNIEGDESACANHTCPAGSHLYAAEDDGLCQGRDTGEVLEDAEGNQYSCFNRDGCVFACEIVTSCDDGVLSIERSEDGDGNVVESFRCDASGSPCANVDCDGHGTCRVVDDVAECSCDDGYVSSGAHCDTIRTCRISGKDYEEGETNPANPCLVCDPDEDLGSWTDNDGASCNDGIFCNGTDRCDGGSCSVHPGNPCDDDLFCNGAETCNEAAGTCLPGSPPCPEDDGVFCNGAEVCIEADDVCGHADAPCQDDGAYCNGVESCNEGTDECEARDVPCGDDGIFCNGAETCDEEDDTCGHGDDPCPDNGVYCDGTETCDENRDACTHVSPPCPDNGFFCEGEETCSEADRACSSTGNPCPDNGFFCDGSETCNETTDQCQHTGDPCVDDGVFCNGPEVCHERGDNYDCVSDGDPCVDDGVFCNGAEVCDETAETCGHTGDPCDDDGVFCNGGEFCDETDDACASEGNPCLDDSYCNGDEVCVEATNDCGPAVSQPCGDDGLHCNGAEYCDEAAGCGHTGSPCSDDGEFCNGAEVCVEADDSCAHSGDPCDPDAEVCTEAQRACLLRCYTDVDGDGYGDPASMVAATACVDSSQVENGQDCDDRAADIHEGALEVPDDGVDQDCSGADLTRSDAVGVFVATTGLDTNDGTMEAPLRTIGAGVSAALSSGKQVFVAAGRYPETVDAFVSLHGGYDASSWVRDVAVNTTTIEGSGTAGVIVPTDARVAVTGLTIRGGRSGSYSYGVRMRSGSWSLLYQNVVQARVADIMYGVYVEEGAETVMARQDVRLDPESRNDTTMFAANIDGRAAVLNSLLGGVYLFSLDRDIEGINVGATGQLVLVNSTVYAGGAQGNNAVISAAGSELWLVNNIVAAFPIWGRPVSSAGDIHAVANCLHGSEYGSDVWFECGTGVCDSIGQIVEDPDFLDGSYHISDASPCRDTGVDPSSQGFYYGWLRTDFEGEPRPYPNGHWDLGWDEYHP